MKLREHSSKVTKRRGDSPVVGAVFLRKTPRLTSVVLGKRGKGRLCQDSAEELQLPMVALLILDFKDTQLDFYRLLRRDNLHAQGRFPITTLVSRSCGGFFPVFLHGASPVSPFFKPQPSPSCS